MSYSTDTYDCHWEPSGIYAILDMRDLGESEKISNRRIGSVPQMPTVTPARDRKAKA